MTIPDASGKSGEARQEGAWVDAGWSKLQEALLGAKTAQSAVSRVRGALSRGSDPRAANVEGLTGIGTALGKFGAEQIERVLGAAADDLCASFGHPGSTGEKGMPTLLAAAKALGEPNGWGSVEGRDLDGADARVAGLVEMASRSSRFAGLKMAKEGLRAAVAAGAPRSARAFAVVALQAGIPIAAADFAVGLDRPYAWPARLEGFARCLEQAKELGVDLDEPVGVATHGVPRAATLLCLALARVDSWAMSAQACAGARSVAESLVA
jgi:hypothetical protein